MNGISKMEIPQNSFWLSYRFSFGLSVVVLLFVIFFTLPEKIFQSNENALNLDFIDVSIISSHKQNVESSSEEGQIEKTNQEAQHQGDDTPVDVDSISGVPRPKLMGRPRIKHPPLAIELDVEAKAFLRIIINREGVIQSLQIIRVILTKELPAEMKEKLIAEFKQNITTAFTGKKYTPFIVNGKAYPADMTQEIEINLQ